MTTPAVDGLLAEPVLLRDPGDRRLVRLAHDRAHLLLSERRAFLMGSSPVAGGILSRYDWATRLPPAGGRATAANFLHLGNSHRRCSRNRRLPRLLEPG